MTARNYSNVATPTTLTSGLSSATPGTTGATVAVASTTGFPSAPFTIAIERGTANEELLLVTAVAGLNLTCTRGYDTSNAPAHSNSMPVEHVTGAIDYREANAHINASTGVHGITGAVVGTTDTQTLTGKTIDSHLALATVTGLKLTTSGSAPGSPNTGDLWLDTATAGVGVVTSVAGRTGDVYLGWKEPVRAASTANVTIASALVNGLVMDGVTLATGDRVLLKDQSTASQNGIYVVVASGAASRAPDADTASKLLGMDVRVTEGTLNGNNEFYLGASAITLGTTSLNFVRKAILVAGRGGSVLLVANDIDLGAFPGSAYSIPAGQLTIQSGASGTASLVTKAPTGTASAERSQQWQTSGGSTVAYVDGNGALSAADVAVGVVSISRGYCASAKLTSNFTLTTASTEVMIGLNATFTFVAGRRYRIMVKQVFQNLSATQGTGTMKVKWASGASVTTAGTQIGSALNAFPAVAAWRITFIDVIEVTCVASGAGAGQINAGQNTVGVSGQIPTANSLAEGSGVAPGLIHIEDIGV